ncbi:hypothetical protein DFH06DRAFT_555715 [Mycena polygramma]|nr:hypothetical protein DFH06DRAFT_555715 [Mycena polygramma]
MRSAPPLITSEAQRAGRLSSHSLTMFSKSLLLGFLHIAHAADILTFKIKDYQGRMLDLTSGSPTPLAPIQSAAETKNKTQNWLFIYAQNGDENEYRVLNAAVPTILSYTTAGVGIAPSGAAIHTQIVGSPNVSTFWDVVAMPKGNRNGSVNFIEKESRLAMTAWPSGRGKGSNRSSPVSNFAALPLPMLGSPDTWIHGFLSSLRLRSTISIIRGRGSNLPSQRLDALNGKME